jgi:hypothetical protein
MTVASATLNPPTDSFGTTIADWIEIAMLATGRRMVSPGKAAEILQSVGTIVDEADVALAFGVLKQRSDRGLSLYPFRFRHVGLIREDGADPTCYSFLVLLTAVADGTLSLEAVEEPAVMLERIVTVAAGGLFGPYGQAIRFGFPPEPGRPSIFADAVEWLARQLGARTIPLGGGALGGADGGVDVVSWRKFGSEGAGPCFAIQVTYGRDLHTKALMIAATDLSRWMRIGPSASVLASPWDAGRSRDVLEELTTRVHVLDRWRILELIECADSTGHPNAQWLDEVSVWTNGVTSAIAI